MAKGKRKNVRHNQPLSLMKRVKIFLLTLFSKKRRDLYEDERPYLVYRYVDAETNENVVVELLCTCGWNVSAHKTGYDGFWCGHCDRTCEEGLPTCYFCQNLANSDAEAIIAKYEAMKDEDEDED